MAAPITESLSSNNYVHVLDLSGIQISKVLDVLVPRMIAFQLNIYIRYSIPKNSRVKYSGCSEKLYSRATEHARGEVASCRRKHPFTLSANIYFS